jgi:hypothetical protein
LFFVVQALAGFYLEFCGWPGARNVCRFVVALLKEVDGGVYFSEEELDVHCQLGFQFLE